VVACVDPWGGWVYHAGSGMEGCAVTQFERYSPAIAVFFLASFSMSAIFGTIIWYMGSPVMPEAYGPIVYAIPAWVWVSVQAMLSLVAAVGAALNRPYTAAIGCGLVGALFMFFAFGATYGGFVEPYLVAVSWPCSAICCLASWVCWRGRDGAR